MNARKRQAMQALLTDPNIDVMEYHQENILSNNQNPVTNGQDLNQYSVFEDIIIPNAQEQTPYSVSEDINMSNAQEQNQTVHSLPTIQNINVMEYQQENTLSNNQNPVTAGHVSVEICISNGQERKKYSVSQDIVIPNAQERNQCSVSQEIVIPNAQEQNQALNSLPTNQNIHVMEYQEDKTLCNYQNQVTNCNVSEDIIIPIAQEQNQGSVSEEQTQCPPTKVLRRSARIALMNANKQCKIKEPGVKDEKIRGTKKTIAMKKKAKKSVLKKLASKGTQTEFILEQVTSNANMQPTSIARQSYDRAAQTLQDTAGSSNAFQLIGDYFSRFFR
ncbi:uncharacterized protein [Drosophila kikkawai]|uniref:Uncharacterized protein n=1 Tax=Drosophila kikkawai TaxID=30033 RepID=A0ABM4GR06_DROKI